MFRKKHPILEFYIRKKLFFYNTNYIKVDITVNDPQPQHECSGLFRCLQKTSTSDRDSLSATFKIFGRHPNSVLGQEKRALQPNLTNHIKHNQSSIRQAVPPPLQSYSVIIQTWGKVAVHTAVNQKGKRVQSYFNFSHLKSALTVRGSPRPFPGKEAGKGARTQAPF